jgi:hypothetical protein
MVEVEVAVAVEVVATVEMLEVVGDSVVTAALPEAEVLEALQEEAMEALPQAEEVDTEAPLEAEVHQEEVTAVHPEAEDADMVVLPEAEEADMVVLLEVVDTEALQGEVLEDLQEEGMVALPEAEVLEDLQEEVTAVHPEAEEVDMEALLLAEVHLEEAGTEARLVLVETFMEVLLEEEALGDLPAVDTGAHQAATEI